MAAITDYTDWIIRNHAATPTWDVYSSRFTDDTDKPIENADWMRVIWSFSRTTPANTGEDRAQFKLDLAALGNDYTPQPIVDADLTGAETAFATWWTAVKPLITPNHTLVEWTWLRMRYENPMTVDQRFADSGSPARVTTVGTAGTNGVASYLPYQSSLSVTFRTPVRRHWGRFYIPGLAGEKIGSTGRVASATVDVVANATDAMLSTLNTNEFPVIIPSTQHAGEILPAWLGVGELQVDDVPDVQRRRRGKVAAYRKRINA